MDIFSWLVYNTPMWVAPLVATVCIGFLVILLIVSTPRS
jgi:hypothetical protein